MKAPESSGGFDRKLVPQGTHLATCYSMIQLGTVEQEYMGETKMLHKVMLTFEIPEETITIKKDDKEVELPMSISKEYTFSMGDKATLRKDLESWRGKAFTEEEAKNFEIDVLLSKPCLLNIVHKTSRSGKERAEIAGISPLMKGMAKPTQINKSVLFSFDTWDLEVFNSLPEWIRKKIESSQEYQAKGALAKFDMPEIPEDEPLELSSANDAEDDLPF